jgi:hypothetical protein
MNPIRFRGTGKQERGSRNGRKAIQILTKTFLLNTFVATIETMASYIQDDGTMGLQNFIELSYGILGVFLFLS